MKLRNSPSCVYGLQYFRRHLTIVVQDSRGGLAQEDPNRFTEWLLAWREYWPDVRDRFLDWVDQCKEEPGLIWETTAVRYATYLMSGLLLVWIVSSVTQGLTPPPPKDARAQATTADFHVVCSQQSCQHHFVIHRSFGFRHFPVKCPKCEQLTGVHALRCFSKTCQGHWVAPVKIGGMQQCPVCGDAIP